MIQFLTLHLLSFVITRFIRVIHAEAAFWIARTSRAMTLVLRLTSYAILPFLLFNQNAYAGAWTQKQDASYVAAALTNYQSDAFLDLQGNEQAQPQFNKWEVNLYGEYGWSDDL